jgi:prepilin-type N-terminal cleavage/methylation domain-containing protein
MKKGFTLIEILVVISIIAILSSVVLAALSTARAKAVTAAGQVFEGQMYQAYGANAVAIWNFDDGAGASTAADSSGNNNILTINSPAAIETTNVFRGKSAFYATSSVTNYYPATVTFSSSNPTFSATNGSISFWINLITNGSQRGIFCSQYPSQFQFCIVDSDNPGGLGYFIEVIWGNIGGGHLTTSIPASSVLSKWTQVAVSWSCVAGCTNTGSMNIYVNGNLAASSSNYTPPTPGTAFCVGGNCDSSGGGDDLNGYLDEMRIYSQSLQTGEIQKIYAESAPHYEQLLASANAQGRK